MNIDPFPSDTVLGAFLLGLSALFSIVNPIGSALLFAEKTTDQTEPAKVLLARRIAVYSAALLLGALWLGSYVLALFGVSLGALRIGGGLVVAAQGWQLLSKADPDSGGNQDAAAADAESQDRAFFPLTMPLTVGPGALSVAVALSSQRPVDDTGLLSFFAGMTLAVVAIAIIIWFTYLQSSRLVRLLGGLGARIAGRLIAFLLLCLGVQIVVTGIDNIAGHIAGTVAQPSHQASSPTPGTLTSK